MSRAAWRATNRLRRARAEIEMALRPPGDMPVVSRQILESIADDLTVVDRLIPKIADGHDE